MKEKIGKIYDWCKTVIDGFLGNKCSMHAAGLTYFSMLSLVPILCIVLLCAKAMGADDLVRAQIDRQIDAMITNIESGQDHELAAVATMDEKEREEKKIVARAFGTQAREISNTLFERIDKFDMGTLGWIGFIALLWTVINSISMVEISMNEIWHVEKARPMWKRAWLYLLIVIVVPVLTACAMSVPILNIVKNIIISTAGATSLTKWLSDGLIWLLDSWILRTAIALSFATFTFAFIFWAMPNCKVCFRNAAIGGVVTAVAFGGWMKLCAVAQVGIAKSSALYGSFAFLPIVLAWLYMSWQIVLLGANMVYALDKHRSLPIA